MDDPTVSGGTGQALDPTVEVQEINPEDVAALDEDKAAIAHNEAVASADRKIAALEAKIERQKEHLAGAEQGLEEAKAERAALDGWTPLGSPTAADATSEGGAK